MSLKNFIRWLTIPAFCLLTLALACGPAAQQPGPDESTIAQPPAQATNPTPTARPTRTPYPTDYIKPTDLPTHTPFPTLPPDPTPEVRPFEAADHTAVPTLAEQVTQYARDEMYNYDVVARVRALSHRTVRPDLSINWPNDEPPYFDSDNGAVPWRRTRIQVVEAFHGRLSVGYELLAPTLSPNPSLEVNREYFLFIFQAFGGEDDFPGESGRYHFNEEQLKAFGGKGGWLSTEQAWVIDGDAAWRVPIEHFWDTTPESNLAAAKAAGESLSVTELVAAHQCRR